MHLCVALEKNWLKATTCSVRLWISSGFWVASFLSKLWFSRLASISLWLIMYPMNFPEATPNAYFRDLTYPYTSRIWKEASIYFYIVFYCQALYQHFMYIDFPCLVNEVDKYFVDKSLVGSSSIFQTLMHRDLIVARKYIHELNNSWLEIESTLVYLWG